MVQSAGLQNTPTASLQGGKTFPMCPGYDTKKFNGNASVMLEFGGMWSISLLPSSLSPLQPRMVAPDRVLSMGEIKLNCIVTLD